MSDVFALTNPITKITGKPSSEFTREDLIKVILEKNIERITLHYTSLDGKLKEFKIPICNRRQAELILTEGERVDGSSLFKGIIQAGKSDIYVVPQYKTAFLNPFDQGSLDLICRFIGPDGEPVSFTPDNILHKAASLIRKRHGLELHALGELEFYLLFDNPSNSYSLPSQRGYHAASPFVKTGEVLNQMLRMIAQISGNVKYAHHEVGMITSLKSDFDEINNKWAEQVEIEFLPTPIEDTADIMVLAKWIVRNVAYRNGMIATFLPKLEVGHAGNGMHFHMQLMKDDKNIMCDGAGELSEQSKMLIGGLCQYAPSLTAFGNMIPSSYLRLVPHQEAPTRVCWSECNRSALIRVPLGWSKVNNLCQRINPQQELQFHDAIGRQTVELRSPDGSAFVHLLLAGLSLATEYGLTNKNDSLILAKNSYIKGNVHDSGSADDYPELPTSCVESAERLFAERRLYERDDIFPPEVISHFGKQLKAHNDDTLNNRMLALAEEEKKLQSRRIMHIDLHKH